MRNQILSTFIIMAIVLLSACGPDSQRSAEGNSEQVNATTATVAHAELGDWGVDLANRDLSVDPGQNFFRYANGSWLDNTPIPEDKGRFGVFDNLRDRTDQRVRGIINDLVSSEPVSGSMEQKIADFYLSYLNTEQINQRGIEPILPLLSRIESIENIAALTTAFGRSQIDTTSSPFSFGIGPDRVNPDRHQLSIAVSGISLPDRDYYLLENDRFTSLRAQYLEHIATILGFAGFPDTASQAEAVLQVETAIAEIMWPRDVRRNRELTHNPMTYNEFTNTYAGFDWDNYFSSAGVAGLEDLNVNFPSAMSPIIDMVNSVPLEAWKSYLAFQLISNNAEILSEQIDNERFRFFGTELNGIPAQRERWERAVLRVGGLNSLGEALGQIYVSEYFPESAKRQMEALVENLRSALQQSIMQNDWMDDATRNEAVLKLQAFRPKIAYPNVWKDLSAIDISRDDLYANARSVLEFFYQDRIARLGKPTDRGEWGMTPHTVNAYYNSSFNEIVFPAGILQAPFFDPAADLAVNYGAIGGVIGHEMGHGFDDQGSKSDYQGVQRNWWSDSVREEFDRRTTMLADQYSRYEPLPGAFIDGRFTLGENIGDVGGLSIAYRAYRLALNGEEAPVIDGLTGDQRFYLSWAQVWLGKIRDDALVSQLKSDPHSPAAYRVNGTVRNHDAWHQAFSIEQGDSMYLPPEQRVRIW
jgi:putative endopeptidase